MAENSGITPQWAAGAAAARREPVRRTPDRRAQGPAGRLRNQPAGLPDLSRRPSLAPAGPTTHPARRAAPSPSRVPSGPRVRPRVRPRVSPSTPPPPPAARSPQRRRRCHIVENVTARAVPAPGCRYWPKRSLICIPGGPDLRAPRVHWLQRPSLSLHKTHMEFHVHRVGSSMKTRSARTPSSSSRVVPSTSGLGIFHSRLPASAGFGSAEWRVPPRARGSWARAGTGSGAPRSGRPGTERSLRPRPWKAATFGNGPEARPRERLPADSFIHSLPFIHLLTPIHSPLGAEAARGPSRGRGAGAPGASPAGLRAPRSFHVCRDGQLPSGLSSF